MSRQDSETPHGSNSSYVKGCRCEECKQGHANYQKVWRDNQPKSEAVRKRYSRVRSTEPPKTKQEWIELEPDMFWFFQVLYAAEHKGMLPFPPTKKKKK